MGAFTGRGALAAIPAGPRISGAGCPRRVRRTPPHAPGDPERRVSVSRGCSNPPGDIIPGCGMRLVGGATRLVDDVGDAADAGAAFGGDAAGDGAAGDDAADGDAGAGFGAAGAGGGGSSGVRVGLVGLAGLAGLADLAGTAGGR